MYKILTGKYDADVTPKLTRVYGSTTRGNVLKLDKGRAKYDLHKYYFTNRVVNAWNSLTDHVVIICVRHCVHCTLCTLKPK